MLTVFSIDFGIESEIFAIAGGSGTQRSHLYVDYLIIDEGNFPVLHKCHRIVASWKTTGGGQASPVVAIWAAAVVVPVVSSAPSQAVRAAAKGIAHKIYASLNSSVKKLLI